LCRSNANASDQCGDGNRHQQAILGIIHGNSPVNFVFLMQ
jgi:hypothetical protein